MIYDFDMLPPDLPRETKVHPPQSHKTLWETLFMIVLFKKKKKEILFLSYN